MKRRGFLGVVAATPIAVACRAVTAPRRAPSDAARDAEKLLGELRAFAVPEGVAPAITFAPLRQPRP